MIINDLFNNKKFVAEGMAGKVVFSGTGADGGKYEIIQSSPTDFMIHANGKHIDTYGSLQRAMSVLKNEVPGLQQGVAEAAGSREKFTDLKSWAAAAKQQGLRVGPANGDSNYSYWAVGKGGEVFGKFVTTRVPQNNHGYIKKQGVAEGSGEAEAYKAHLIKTMPQIMNFLSKKVKGWTPGEEEMLSAIDTAYMVMKHTGDVKQAGKAMMDELNTLHRMSQGQQGVAEGMKAHELSQYCEELVAEKGWDAAYKHASMMANMGRDPAWNGVLKYLDAMKQDMAEGLWDQHTSIPELEQAIKNLIMGYKGGVNLTDKGRAQLLLSINKGKRILAKKKQQQGMAEGTLDEAVGMMIKGAAISGDNDQDIADRIAAKTGGRVDSGSYGHHVLITYPTTQHRAAAAVKIRKMFPGIELCKSGGNRNAIDEQGMAEGSLNEFAPSVATGGGKKDYGQPVNARYMGGNKFVVGTTNNYILTATIDKYGLDWDDGWYLDSPGAAHLSDASEGEIPLPISTEQRHSIHDTVTDYLNNNNVADLQKVARHFGHGDDGQMNEQGMAEGIDQEDPFELSSDYALYIANSGRKMMTQLTNMSRRIQTDTTAAQNAKLWNLGDFMHQHYEIDDLNAINQVFEEYGVGGFFEQNLYDLLANWSSQGLEYVTAWKQYSGDVVKNSTRKPSAQSVQEQGMAEDDAAYDPFANDPAADAKHEADVFAKLQQQNQQGKGTKIKDMNPIDRDQYLKNTNRQWDEKTQRSVPVTKSNVQEVSLGDYRKKAMMSKAMAQTDQFFGRDDPAAVAAADRTIANRTKGLAGADARTRPYTAPPVDQEKQRRDLADKYPNIDELVRRAELNRDPQYDRADGLAYYNGRDAEHNYHKLKQIQRMIRGAELDKLAKHAADSVTGINEEPGQVTVDVPGSSFTADKSTNTLSGTTNVHGVNMNATKDMTPGGATTFSANMNVAPNLNIAATQKSADYNKGQLAGTKSVAAKYTDTTGALGKPGQQHTATRTAGVGFGGASGANVGKNYVDQYSVNESVDLIRHLAGIKPVR